MKKITLLILICFVTISTFAQKAKTIIGNITSNTTFYSDTVYTLDGFVYVKNDAILTIQPGTIIKGKSGNRSTLIVTRNGRIEANGTATRPIVFTSDKAAGLRAKGDWGGIVILGKAKINRPTDCSTCPGSAVAASEAGIQNAVEGDVDNAAGDALYGGNDDDHNAGTLRYVRIEYVGTVITPGNEINGLTMGGIGKQTKIEYVQISFSDDDAFEWFGGTADAKYLVSHRNVDDDLDTDFGFTGRIQFALIQRDSNLFDIGSSPTTNGFESDNDGTGTEAKPYTNPTFSNVTVVGPLANNKILSISNSFNNGARIRRNSSTSIYNSIFMGWNDGVFVDGTRTGQKHQNDSMSFKNNILAGNLRAVNNSSFSGARTKVLTQNDSIFSATGILNDPFNYTNPSFAPITGSPALTGASFTDARVSDGFFTTTTYRGAIDPTNNWTNCWCNFNPQISNYDNGPLNLLPLTYDAGKDSTICSGRTIVIGQTITGPYKASWSPAAGLSSTTAARPSANPTVTTKYYVTVSDTITGCSLMDSITVTVNTTPVANFTSATGTGAGVVNFTSTSTNATTYSWNFGDGNTSTLENPSNTYAANGTYTVRLTAISGTCNNATSRQINVTGIASPVRAFTGDINENTTFYADTIYFINGYTFVKNNAVLTIQPGTIIKGGANKATLIITRNGRIEANGTKNQPIVFTSAKPAGQRSKGDWGGIVILGKAKINRPTDCSTCPGAAVASSEAGIQNAVEGDIDNANGDALYGGNDDNHNAGTLRYVRIEYAGTVITPGNEINGLTMGGIGKQTKIEYVQVSFADDDAFEWFGGTADAKYLVSHRNVDDDLDTDFGFTGRIQFALIQRDSNLFDLGSGPTTNGFESDNDGSGTEAKPYTDPTFSNVTVVGPLANNKILSISTSFNNGARIRRNSSTSIYNSIFMGWNEGVFVDGTRTGQKHQNDSMSFKNNILAGNLRAINNSSFSGARAKVLSQNDSIFSANGILNDPFNYTNPSFAPIEGSPALTGASFADARVADAFFTQTPFRGAMGNNPDSNWTNCWCNFDPQNANYNSSPINNPAATANFTAPTTSNSLKVDFANTSSNAVSYMWDFGVTTSTTDTSSSASPSFTYPANGKYTVTLLAKSKCGNSIKTFEITINDVSILPIVDFTFAQNTTTGSRELTFTNTTTEKGLTIDYAWKFGDAATANTKNATHTYTSNGSYTVTLIATHIYGVDSVSKTINVIATSVSEEVSAFNNFVMYPNPTRENVTIDFNLIKSETVSISVMDLSGKEIISVPSSRMNVGKQSMELSTSELSEGMYIVRVNGVESSISSRLVIIK